MSSRESSVHPREDSAQVAEVQPEDVPGARGPGQLGALSHERTSALTSRTPTVIFRRARVPRGRSASERRSRFPSERSHVYTYACRLPSRRAVRSLRAPAVTHHEQVSLPLLPVSGNVPRAFSARTC